MYFVVCVSCWFNDIVYCLVFKGIFREFKFMLMNNSVKFLIYCVLVFV